MPNEKEFNEIPIYVLEGLSEARSNSSCNMIDRAGVTRLVHNLGHREAALWLFDGDDDQYFKAMETFPEWEETKS